MNTDPYSEVHKDARPIRPRKRLFRSTIVVSLVLALLVVLVVVGILTSTKLITWRLPSFTLFSFGGSLRPAIDGTTCGKWEIAYGSQHNLGSANSTLSQLRDIVAVSDDDIWAIGHTVLKTVGSSQALIEHWDGKAWHIVPSPEPYGTVGTYLSDIVAISADDIWVVGSYFKEPSHSSEWTLTMHWDGKQWSIVPSPNVGLERNSLTSVAAVSSDDVWAVGTYEFENTEPASSWGGWRIQVLHWDGKKWSIVPSPVYEVGPHADTFSNSVSDILAVSSHDIWAFGDYHYDDHAPPYKDGPLIMRWNGADWRITNTSLFSTTSDPIGNLGLAYTTGADSVWALGQNDDEETLLIQWDGTQWSAPAAPIVGYDHDLSDVVAIGQNDVWATGSSGKLHGTPDTTLILHWNGVAWGLIESPNALRNTYFTGITATPSGDIWVAGSTTDDPYEPHTVSLPRYALAAHFLRMPCPKSSDTVIVTPQN